MIWLLIDCLLLIGVLIFGAYYHHTKGWKSGGFLFSAEDNVIFLWRYIVPQLFCFLSVVLGLIYFSFSSSINIYILSILLIFPGIYLLSSWVLGLLTISRAKREEKKEYLERKSVNNWLKQFSFLHEKDSFTNLYHSKGVLKGNVWIDSTKENLKKINKRKKDLPESIKLNLNERTETLQKWYESVYKFVEKLEKDSSVNNVENYVSYDDKNKKHGTIYIVTEPENFKKLQTLAIKELPKGITLKMCKHAWLIHQLSTRLEYKEELDKEYKNDYLILET